MKIELFFRSAIIEIPDDEPILALDEDGNGVSDDDLLIHIEENWAELVDPTLPAVGAMRRLPFLPISSNIDIKRGEHVRADDDERS
jgi:hypothetical protein